MYCSIPKASQGMLGTAQACGRDSVLSASLLVEGDSYPCRKMWDSARGNAVNCSKLRELGPKYNNLLQNPGTLNEGGSQEEEERWRELERKPERATNRHRDRRRDMQPCKLMERADESATIRMIKL